MKVGYLMYILIVGILFLSSEEAFSQQVFPQPAFDNLDTTRTDSPDTKRLRILNSDLLSYERRGNLSVQKLIGNVQIWHDSTYFYCDSAYHFENDNRLEAYDNVKIVMQDSVTLTSDKLIYDSETKIAEVYDNITLTDQSVVLTTNRLTYLREEDYGYYKDGGKLVDGENVLTSEFGYYYPQDKMAYFKKQVLLESPDYILRTDTLGYNTDAKIATFITLTQILSEDGEIITTDGNYETEIGRVNLFERSVVKDSSYTMEADTIFYDDQENLGFATGNVIVQQEDSTLEIRGQFGQFNRLTDESMLTDNPVAIQSFEDDTLYLFADTLLSRKIRVADTPKAGIDSLMSDSLTVDSLSVDSLAIDSLEQIRDSISAEVDSSGGDKLLTDTTQLLEVIAADTLIQPETLPDSISSLPDSVLAMIQGQKPKDTVAVDSIEKRVFSAFNSVTFFMNDMQGKADSLVYWYDDSIIYFFQDPVLWSDLNQISGDTIIVWMKNGKADSMWVGPNAFLASAADTVGFNQLKGKEMRAKFRDNKLVRMHVIGNSESIYFAKNEEDSTNAYYEGMNQALAQEIVIYFQENEVSRIVFLAKPEGTFYPFFEVVFKENKLDGMRWRISEKPIKPEIFMPIPVQPPEGSPILPDPSTIPQSETSALPPPEENR